LKSRLKVTVVGIDRRIPKSAVKPLMEYCMKLAKETGGSAADLFRYYLESIKKNADYFFSEPWPEKPQRPTRFFEYINEEDKEFIGAAENYEDECERFTVVCLRRSISMEGFDSDGFIWDSKVISSFACGNCVVPEVAWLRNQTKRIEQARREVEEDVKSTEPSSLANDMHNYYNKPEVIREHKMLLVNLRFFEEFGDAKGKSCEVNNKYRCPYEEKSKQLSEKGRLTKAVWRYIEWYNAHWNRSLSITPPDGDMKWYHYDELSIIDVTSYDDIVKAIDDGRFKRIVEEHKRYMKETGLEEGML